MNLNSTDKSSDNSTNNASIDVKFPVPFRPSDPIFNAMGIGGHGFPSMWRYMLPKEFSQLKIPNEALADCSACPMVALGEFLPSCRCCTHRAQIPNFQLGLALKDPRTRPRVQKIIRQGYAVPTGIDITPSHLAFTVDAYRKGLFGKSEALLCPFMNRESETCVMYAYRTVVCSSFHCGHDHGDIGSEYWDTLETFVAQVEIAIGQWAMEKTGMDVQEYMNRRDALADNVGALSSGDTRVWSTSARSALFGKWSGKEELFFETCADFAMSQRKELWKIACQTPLLEAPRYEAALDKFLHSAAEGSTDDCSNEDGESSNNIAPPTSVQTLWTHLQNATDALWTLPGEGKQLLLNPAYRLNENPKNDTISKFYNNKPTIVFHPSQRDEEPLSAMFLSKIETDALRVFKTPQTVTDNLFQRIEFQGLPHPKDFLAQCINCAILIIQDKER